MSHSILDPVVAADGDTDAVTSVVDSFDFDACPSSSEPTSTGRSGS